jgi:hypothetical protein
MDGGVAFARAANTALISICGELQWSYELFCSCDLFVRRRVATLITSTLLAQLQGEGRLSPRPALPGTCTHVHMYTCTLYAHGPHGVTHRRGIATFRHSVFLATCLCLDPGLNPITNDQTPRSCYRMILINNVKLWN